MLIQMILKSTENLDDLVDDIKNHVVDIEDISFNAFQDSGAYQELTKKRKTVSA